MEVVVPDADQELVEVSVGELQVKPLESTKSSLHQRLAARAAKRWPQLAGLSIRWQGERNPST